MDSRGMPTVQVDVYCEVAGCQQVCVILAACFIELVPCNLMSCRNYSLHGLTHFVVINCSTFYSRRLSLYVYHVVFTFGTRHYPVRILSPHMWCLSCSL